MNLSNNVISQFVKITNDNKKKEDNTKAYGKVVIHDDQQYVQLDGSDLLTPVDSTVHVKDNDRVTVTIKGHTAIIDGNTSDISASSGQLTVVQSDVSNAMSGMNDTVNKVDMMLSEMQVVVDGMSYKVDTLESSVDNMETAISKKVDILELTVDGLETEVSKKIETDDVGTIVIKNAESWGLSINGKLSGTNYKFDGTNFIIGSSTGNTAAYHASGYSKWTHSDGSYTRVDNKGLNWSKGGTTYGYHYLLYSGEYTCDSESTVTVTLPDEFKGKNFKVVTSIKRIYPSNEMYITAASFPLLSFYAEARNINKNAGQFQLYASIRAWARDVSSGAGTTDMVVGDSSNDKSLLKLIVAYWVFV